MPALEGHIAAITGSGSGIGRAIALGYAREGAQVIALDMNGDAVAETARAISGAGGKAHSFVLDVRERERCREVAASIEGQFGPISILVIAGINQPHTGIQEARVTLGRDHKPLRRESILRWSVTTIRRQENLGNEPATLRGVRFPNADIDVLIRPRLCVFILPLQTVHHPGKSLSKLLTNCKHSCREPRRLPTIGVKIVWL